ncbi:MAG: BON domain-containing protein [Terriglobales bacterium]
MIRKSMQTFMVVLVAGLLLAQQEPMRGGRWDAQIQKEVSEELARHDDFRQVRAATEDGIVTLTGEVALYRDKLRAEKKVRGKDHVDGVRNHITVQGGVEDAELRRQLADKLRYDRIGYGIQYNNLTLAVRNGVVTIGGNVRDEPDRASALAIVEGVRGVTGVEDNIQVAPVSGFDDDIRIRTARAIYGDPALQKYAIDPQAPIRIVVERGHVTLYGAVLNSLDRQLAETRARGVSGVFSVKNELVVANDKNDKKVKKNK